MRRHTDSEKESVGRPGLLHHISNFSLVQVLPPHTESLAVRRTSHIGHVRIVLVVRVAVGLATSRRPYAVIKFPPLIEHNAILMIVHVIRGERTSLGEVYTSGVLRSKA